MTPPRERPMLFSGPLVRAILDGRKTATRRPMKPQPPERGHNGGALLRVVPSLLGIGGDAFDAQYDLDNPRVIKCPFGAPGDRIWCRETFSTLAHGRAFGGRVRYEADQAERIFDEMPDREDRWRPLAWKKWPSIHCPRWASRLSLEITRVRVERVQDITEQDARAEGAECMGMVFRNEPKPTLHPEMIGYRGGFACLWEQVYGAGAWERNGWAWALDFRVVTP